MNHNKAPWQRTLEEFAGPGIHYASDTMRVGESEARDLLAGLATVEWQTPVHVGSGTHAGYTIRNANRTWSTALFHQGAIVGFYAGSNLWIAGRHRGRGLATHLILAAACHRGGTILPPGVVFQGYTPVGVAAHRSAHHHAVLTAVAAGLPVPPEVIEEMHRHGDKRPQARA